MKNTTRAVIAALLIISIAAVLIPQATAAFPTGFGSHYPQMPSGWMTGQVTGRVTTQHTTQGIGGAYVSIVNASNNNIEYVNGTADSLGYYQFTGVNATVDDNSYMAYANLTKYGEGYSHMFGVNSGATSTTSVIIFLQASTIKVQAERDHVLADGADNIQVTASVYDDFGNTVGDGTTVWFTLGDMSGLASWTYPNGTPMNQNNGSLGQYNSVNNATAFTKGGTATVDFGWVPDTMGGNNTTIHAYVANSPNINGSVTIRFIPMAASWTGYVVDSYGTGYGGITVTLHIKDASNGEIYDLTSTTSTSKPFVGLYVFDNVVVTPTSAWGFADASAQFTDNMTIYGRSNNYSLNKSSTSSGFIVLHVPPPDAIYVTADPSTILVGGDTSIITAQLYLNGQPYHRSNINIQFSSDNDTVASLPAIKTNVSDLNGQATIPLTSNRTIGWVNVTANASIMYGMNITNSTLVKVVGWGTVSGIVTDQNKVGIPYANVTLWYAVQNSSIAEQYDNNGIVKIPENPQQSNDGRTAAVGMYTYYRVPWGLYNVTAEKEGHVYYAVFALGPSSVTGVTGFSGEIGTATHNIALPDYAYMPPGTVTVTAISTPAMNDATMIPTATLIPTPSPGFQTLFALAGFIFVASMIARKEN
jgi:hypothetical protein